MTESKSEAVTLADLERLARLEREYDLAVRRNSGYAIVRPFPETPIAALRERLTDGLLDHATALLALARRQVKQETT